MRSEQSNSIHRWLEITKHKQADVDASAAGQAFTVVRLVEALLERWGVEPPGVLRAGGVGVRDLRRTARDLELDERGAALLIEVAHAAGLIAPDGEAADSWLPTTGYDLWLAKSVADRWVLLVSAWLVTTRVPGLVGRRELPFIRASADPDAPEKLQPAANALGADLDRALAPIVRREVLEILLRASAGEAPTADSISESLQWSWPRRGGRLRDELASWTIEEAELLGLTGRGALSSFARALCTGLYTGANNERGRTPRWWPQVTSLRQWLRRCSPRCCRSRSTTCCCKPTSPRSHPDRWKATLLANSRWPLTSNRPAARRSSGSVTRRSGVHSMLAVARPTCMRCWRLGRALLFRSHLLI